MKRTDEEAMLLRAINCLRLEVPGHIAEDMTKIAEAALASVRKSCAKIAQDWGYDDEQNDTTNALHCSDEISKKILEELK